MSYNSALQKLGEVIVGVGGQASIAFSSIDQRYRSLRLIFDGAASTGANLAMQLNGDTAAHYDRTSGFVGNLGAPSSFTETAQTNAVIGALDSGAAAVMGSVIDIPNYSGTTFQKVAIALGTENRSAGNLDGNQYYVVWRSAAAITSILLFPTSGTFVQDTVASLYGLT